MPKGFHFFFLLTLTLVGVNGCLSGAGSTPQGNADGYAGRQTVRSAYRVDPQASCDQASQTLSTPFRYRIDYFENENVAKTDLCSGERKAVATNELNELDGVVVNHENVVYEFRDSVPVAGDEPFVVAWCFATDVGDQGRLGIFLRTTAITKTPSARLYEGTVGSISVSDPFPTTQVTQGFVRTFTWDGGKLSIRILPRDILANLYPATLLLENQSHPATCTVFLSQLQN